jgi:hypothetical protein
MSPGSVRSIPFGREPASDDNTHFPSSKGRSEIEIMFKKNHGKLKNLQ